MGGKQRKKDKMYVTAAEWATGQGGAGRGKNQSASSDGFQRLPFDCCAIALRPAENPVCTLEGTVFDVLNIVPWIKKFGTDPTTGKPMKSGDIFKIQFHRNTSSGLIQDPVTYKEFNDHTHIVAIRTSGNVYSYESVRELNIKPKNWTDLLTGEKFTRKDIVTIQDPHNFDKKNVLEFKHIKEGMVEEDPTSGTINVNEATARIYAEMDSKKGAAAPKKGAVRKAPAKAGFDGTRLPRSSAASLKAARLKKQQLKDATAATEKKKKFKSSKEPARAHYSTGAMAASFTSTAMTTVTENESAIIPEAKIKATKKKGYVTLETNFGALNFELHTDLVPFACNNFIQHSKNGFYDGTIFHRSIRNFMIQGGDPTGTGKGGESIYGEPFEDEFKPQLQHNGRGILAMANSGKNMNQSQFYITYRSAPHLNNKHTVFGKMVGGRETLNKIERVNTDDNDRPLEKVAILRAVVFVDPFAEEHKEVEVEEEEEDVPADASLQDKGQWFSNPNAESIETTKQGIGKYMGATTMSAEQFLAQQKDVAEPPAKRRKVPKPKGSFGDFSGW